MHFAVDNKTSENYSSAHGKPSRQNIAALPVQAKLTVGPVDDPLEEEADAMADRVMRMPDQNFIQRKCADCEREEKETVHRKPLSEKITPFVQAKSESSGSVNPAVAQDIESSKGSGTSIDNSTQSFMSRRFGANFSNVKVHADNQAAQLNRSLNAKAFTVGMIFILMKDSISQIQ